MMQRMTEKSTIVRECSRVGRKREEHKSDRNDTALFTAVSRGAREHVKRGERSLALPRSLERVGTVGRSGTFQRAREWLALSSVAIVISDRGLIRSLVFSTYFLFLRDSARSEEDVDNEQILFVK